MNNDTAASLATVMICGFVLFVLALLLSTTIAVPAALCLSKKEARQLWPRQHIYWYSKDHCWSNRHGPPRGLHIDPVVKPMAQATSKQPRPDDVVPADQFNEIDAQAKDPFLAAKPLVEFDLRWMGAGQ